MEYLGLFARQAAQPGLELRQAVHGIGDAIGVEAKDHLLVDEDVAPARAGLELAQLVDQFAVVAPERRPGLHVALGQAEAQEQLARRDRVDRAVVDPTSRHDRQPVQRHLFVRGDLAAFALPARRRIAVLDQVARQRFDPAGLDRGDLACVEACRLDQFGSDEPLRLLRIHGRAREHEETAVACAEVLARVAGVAHADVAEQSRQQRAVQGLVVGRLFVVPPAGLVQLDAQLHLHVVPLPHPGRRQEVHAAHALELAPRQVTAVHFEEIPQLQPAEEVGSLVGELRVGLVRLLPLVGRPLARVLYRQPGGDDRDLAQTAIPRRGQQHAPDARIDREARDLAPEIRDLQPAIDRVQFLEQLVPVTHQPRVGGIDERKAGDVAESERRHLQDDRGQVGPLDLRLGEFRPGLEIVFAVEPDADAVGDSPAASLALLGACARHAFDRQTLNLAARAIAADAGEAGVDHVADPGHRQRGLGHVGREHDATPSTGGEHACLLRRRQAGVERYHLAMGQPVLA